MKTRICILILVSLLIFSTAAFAEIIIFSKNEPEARFEIPIDDILNQEWLLSQVDKAPDEFDKLVTALYIMNTYQYGPANTYEEIADTEHTIDGLCKWLELMSFECQFVETTKGMNLLLSDNIQIDIHCEEDIIYRMDLTIKSIDNGYGNHLTISVMK